jgi:Tfp pilus assembly protein PilV
MLATSNFERVRRGKAVERGISIVELLIGISVLAIGMAGLAALFATAIMSNGRSKSDTAGTMLAQTVLEQIAAQPGGGNFILTDCNPNGATNWTVATAGGAAPGAGATVNANTGDIDFANQGYAAVPANYKMQFVSCGNSGRQMTFEVRWNVQTLSANTRLITVAARPLAAAAIASNANQAVLFAQPITLRTIGGL